VGYNTLYNVTTGDTNVALGYSAGYYTATNSTNNVYIGTQAGPSSTTTESNKLYISNNNGTPLIGGDFASGSVTINSILSLTRRTTTPSNPTEGMIIASGSAGSSVLYYYNGSTWNALF
jgi:hypothetical protein